MHSGWSANWRLPVYPWLARSLRMALAGLLLAWGCNSAAPVATNSAGPTGTAADLLATYPQSGDPTSYGLPLAVDNSAMLIGYEQQYKLTAAQEAVKREALTALRAPCCDDRTMYTCCCPCNLAKTVWGLANYLIVEKSYDAAAVRDAVTQWLHFIRPDYYAVQDLTAQGLSPADYGLRDVDSCYDGLCEEPFSRGGCAGMGALKLGN